MSQKRVLFVGDNPYSGTGNAMMLRGLLEQLDRSKYLPSVFGALQTDYSVVDPFVTSPLTVVSGAEPDDPYGTRGLFRCLTNWTFDILCFVGLDIWRYSSMMSSLSQLRDNKGFKWIWLFPYDSPFARPDWMALINMLDMGLPYSEYGYQATKPYCDNVKYFRPNSSNLKFMGALSEESRAAARRKYFPNLRETDILFGYVGKNQIRKDPQKLLKAFSDLIKTHTNVYLYMHTEMVNGVFNLQQFAKDLGIPTGKILSKEQGARYTPDQMSDIYNCFDCSINCSYQEGLSYTVVESLLCGTPVIASDSTAHKELLQGVGILVPCAETTFLLQISAGQPSWNETVACTAENIYLAMRQAADQRHSEEYAKWRHLSALRGVEWASGINDINELLEEAANLTKEIPETANSVLFAQHSAAGDVLMSTQCFKGIKEANPGKKLVYMTQKKFMGLVENNPYVDEVIPWDSNQFKKFNIVYNPHGEKILPGAFNSLDVPLHSMYPHFCGVKPDEIFICQKKPEIQLPERYVVVHTTGGQAKYRTYPHMDMVVAGLDLPVVQIGGESDTKCQKASLDLRGSLTWEESAYVMAHAEAAVVIDSFPSHLAGAVGTPAVVLYGPAPARVVGPRNAGSIINLEPNKLDVCEKLTNCWGNARCESPCIRSISPITVKKALRSLLEKKS